MDSQPRKGSVSASEERRKCFEIFFVRNKLEVSVNSNMHPTGRKFLLEFDFHYLANACFAKFKFCLLIDFHKFCNDSNFKKSKIANILY